MFYTTWYLFDQIIFAKITIAAFLILSAIKSRNDIFIYYNIHIFILL